jgi:hypothetical protein
MDNSPDRTQIPTRELTAILTTTAQVLGLITALATLVAKLLGWHA